MGEKGLSTDSASCFASYPSGGIAVVLGASGRIGRAFAAQLEATDGFSGVLGYSRSSAIALDLAVPLSIEAVAADVTHRNLEIRLVIDATGVLEGDGRVAEKTWRQVSAALMAHAFAVNAIGPALLMKYFLPILPAVGKCVFATLSARVGSISDNRLGGWYSYRASKAALNQIVRTAAIELGRARPDALCVAIHPGTVATRLSERFVKPGLEVQSTETAAVRILTVLDTLTPASSGGFFDQMGRVVNW